MKRFKICIFYTKHKKLKKGSTLNFSGIRKGNHNIPCAKQVHSPIRYSWKQDDSIDVKENHASDLNTLAKRIRIQVTA